MKKVLAIIMLALTLISCGGGGGGETYIPPVNNVSQDPPPVVESTTRDVELQWQPNSESNLAGYRVFMRRDGLDYDYTNPEWETTDTDCTLYNLYKDTTYHFVVRAFNTDGEESGDSNEATLERI